jgi:hypothetical protein
MINDVSIMETSMLSLQHSMPPVYKVQTIPGFTGEQNWNPIVLCPSDMIFTPVQSLPSVLSSQRDSTICSSRVKTCIVKSMPYRLSGNIYSRGVQEVVA